MSDTRTTLGFRSGAMKRATVACATLAFAAVTLAASSAAAQSAAGSTLSAHPPATFLEWMARSVVLVAGDNFDAAQYQTPKGTMYDGVGALFITRPDGNFLCSGALLSGGLNVLTAAHCLADASGTNITQSVTAVFFTPGQPAAVREFVTSSSTHVNPLYTGETIDAHDVGIVSLSAAPSQGVLNSAYSLFTGNPFQTAQMVGSGATGLGSTGETLSGGFTLADRRRALNNIDFTWTDPYFQGFFNPGFFGNADPTTLVSDFDNGLFANNSSCIITLAIGLAPNFCEFGLGAAEGNVGPGDSGGPLFINGQIAGVASYQLSFGSMFGDIDDDLNGSFGEFSGWTSTQYNEDWLAQYATTVPEPGSLALVAFGLVALMGAQKRNTRLS